MIHLTYACKCIQAFKFLPYAEFWIWFGKMIHLGKPFHHCLLKKMLTSCDVHFVYNYIFVDSWFPCLISSYFSLSVEFFWWLYNWVTQKELLWQRPKFLRSTTNYQAINVDTLRAQNMESWPFFNQVILNSNPLCIFWLMICFPLSFVLQLFKDTLILCSMPVCLTLTFHALCTLPMCFLKVFIITQITKTLRFH